MKLWCLITTYNKLEEAYIQMEIIRKLRTPFFDEIYIVHWYNWEWEIEKYLADEVFYSDNPTGYTWAANMLDKGMKILSKHDLDYIYVGGSDCRWIKPETIVKILTTMKEKDKIIAWCPRWGKNQWNWKQVGLSTDTFFIDAKREKENNIFPLNYQKFYDKYIDILNYLWHSTVTVELLFSKKYIEACSRIVKDNAIKRYTDDKLLILQERMPVILLDGTRNYNSIELGMWTDHDITIKKNLLKENNLVLWTYSEKRCTNQ